MNREYCATIVGEHGPMPAVLHATENPSAVGVIVVVGGPQYRVGSHREFVLLGRSLAAQGIPVLRFDFSGMGDAAGPMPLFTETAAELDKAVEFLRDEHGVDRVILWGLCDAASAAILYAWQDARVAGMVLLNPWVRTETTQARARLRYYYVKRLLSRGFWSKLSMGKLAWRGSFKSLVSTLARYARIAPAAGQSSDRAAEGLPDRMATALDAFSGPCLFILSGNDLTAAEFRDLTNHSRDWSRLMDRQQIERLEVPSADHTFSRREWRDAIIAATSRWIRETYLTGQQSGV